MIRYGSVIARPSVEYEALQVRRVRPVEHRLRPGADLPVAVLARRQQPEAVGADSVHDRARDLLHRCELDLAARRPHGGLPLVEAAVRGPAGPLLGISLGPVA